MCDTKQAEVSRINRIGGIKKKLAIKNQICSYTVRMAQYEPDPEPVTARTHTHQKDAITVKPAHQHSELASGAKRCMHSNKQRCGYVGTHRRCRTRHRT